MRTLTNTTTSIRLEFPRTWEPSDLTGVTIQIADTAGTELLSAAAASLYTATTLDGDARRFVRSITLAEGSGDLEIQDLIRIVGVLGYEDHTVKGYSSLDAELENHVDRDFESGAAVYRLHCVATVDLSDTDDFPIGQQLVITWTPTGTGGVLTELAEIEGAIQVDIADFTRKFSASYKRAYSALSSPEDNLDTIIEIAQDELRTDLTDRGLDITRIKDQGLITPPLMALVAVIWARDGDDNTADEYERYGQAYSAALEKLCRLPVWEDSDSDGIKDTGEVQTHPANFERIW